MKLANGNLVHGLGGREETPSGSMQTQKHEGNGALKTRPVRLRADGLVAAEILGLKAASEEENQSIVFDSVSSDDDSDLNSLREARLPPMRCARDTITNDDDAQSSSSSLSNSDPFSDDDDGCSDTQSSVTVNITDLSSSDSSDRLSVLTDNTDQSIALSGSTCPSPGSFGGASSVLSAFDSLNAGVPLPSKPKKSKKSSSKKPSKKIRSKKSQRPKTATVKKSETAKSSSLLRPQTSFSPVPKTRSQSSLSTATSKKKSKRSIQTWFEMKPLFKSQKSTVCFATDCESQADFEAKFEDRRIVERTNRSSHKPVLYYSMDKSIDYPVIKSAFKGAGFKRIKPHTKSWSVRWGKSIKHYEYEQLKPFQRVSHFPGSWNLGNKLKLHYNLMKMKKLHPKDYKFFPSSCVLPEDRDLVINEYTQKKTSDEELYFILKPFNSSCGRGIRVVDSVEDIPEKEKCLCQQYIHNPYLINKRKFDLRIYIVISSFNPLRVYRFNDGLARFATEEYNLDSLGSYSHLTNYSVNKHNQNFRAGDDDADSSSKWSIQGLRKYFADNNIDDTTLWQQVDDLVVKTLISVDFEINSMRKMHCKYKDSAFELLGFDVLIDENLKPWIVEINLGSSLSMSSPLDRRIKTELINQMFHMIGFESVDCKKMKKYKDYSEHTTSETHLGYEKKEQKKKQKYAKEASRNTRIQKLKSKSSIKKLLPEERKLIEKCEEENARRGDFYRIHPTPQSLKRYGHLFREERYRNFVIGKFLALPQEEQDRLLGR